MTSALWAVFRKELIENLRDVRTLASALLIGPLMGPLLFAGLFTLIVNTEKQRAEQEMELPVAGAEHAANLVSYLKQQGVKILPPPEDIEQSIANNEYNIILIIPEGFASQWQQVEPATVELVFDKSRKDASRDIVLTQSLLAAYSAQIGQLRLLARGIKPSVLNALAVDHQDLSTPESRGALLMVILPLFVVMSLFIGSMYLAIDSTAGERERQSLEPLLMVPVPRWQIAMGKLVATLSFSLFSLLLTLIGFALAMRMVPLEELGMKLSLGSTNVVILFLIAAPLALVASALQTVIAAFARSFREAQTYLSVLMLIPVLTAASIQFLQDKSSLLLSLLPVLGQSLQMELIIRGEAAPLGATMLTALVSMVLGSLLCLLVAWLYNREDFL